MGNIYVGDTGNGLVKKFNSSGVYQSQFGIFLVDPGNGLFGNPLDLAFDSSGNIYVVDKNNNRVQKFNSSGTYVSQFGTSGAGNGQFNNPNGIAIDSSDNIYVVDSGNSRIQVFNSSGVYQAQSGTHGSAEGQFNNPFGITFDASENIYVVENGNNRIDEFTSSGAFTKMFGWGVQDGASSFETCTSGCQAGVSTAGTGNGQFNHPIGIALDAAGDIYVSDQSNNRIQKFDSSGAYVSQFGTSGTGNGQMTNPAVIAVDSAGNVFVVDATNNRVQEFTSDGTYITKWGSFGTGNGQFSTPRGVAVDPAGAVYVTDSGTSSRIQKFTLTSVAFSQSVTGLSCGATYHYQAFATNSVNTSNGDDEVFTTSACSANTMVSGGYSYVCTDPKAANYDTYPSAGNISCHYPTTSASLINAPAATTNQLSEMGSIVGVFKYGTKGFGVTLIQKYLNTHGYVIAQTGLGSAGHENTNFGLLTKKAVQKFQAAHGLNPDGVVGLKTRALMI